MAIMLLTGGELTVNVNTNNNNNNKEIIIIIIIVIIIVPILYYCHCSALDVLKAVGGTGDWQFSCRIWRCRETFLLLAQSPSFYSCRYLRTNCFIVTYLSPYFFC